MALNMTEQELASFRQLTVSEAKLELAMVLLEQNRLSPERAAAIAGVTPTGLEAAMTSRNARIELVRSPEGYDDPDFNCIMSGRKRGGTGKIPVEIVSCADLRQAGLTEQEARLELALTLYAQERLTMAQAAQLAGMPFLDFQLVRGSRGIPVHYDFKMLENDLRHTTPVPSR